MSIEVVSLVLFMFMGKVLEYIKRFKSHSASCITTTDKGIRNWANIVTFEAQINRNICYDLFLFIELKPVIICEWETYLLYVLIFNFCYMTDKPTYYVSHIK